MKSKSAKIAYDKGYRIVNGEIISPFRKKPLSFKVADHYPKFNVSHEGKCMTVKVHQLIAWQKYGDKCLEKHLVVRHLDDNRWNLHPDNIILGTMPENYADMRRNRQLDEEEMVDML